MQKNHNTPTLPQTRDPFQSLFQRFFGDTLQEFYGASDAAETPRTNISETETAYELAFELPGLEDKDIQVDVQDHVLTVTAERKEQRDETKRWHRVEHRYGRFTRAVALPKDAAANGVDAVYKQGVLTVTVQKQPEARPVRVQVRGS